MLAMLFVFALVLGSVPLAKGVLSRLTELRLRLLPALFAALALQVCIFLVLAGGPPVVLAVGHLVTYVLAGVFVFANRDVAGLWLVGLGGMLNFAAISANGGRMPASPAALAAAGLPVSVEKFVNSGAVSNPRLAFLGDVFAIPHPFPLATVFSLGDVCLLLGAAVVVHRVTGSRLVPSGAGQFKALRQHPGFLRLWASQGVSSLGDWTYSLAVAASVATRVDSTVHVISALFVAQVAPAALVGLLGGPAIDRIPRRRLMILSDAIRALAVASLFLTGTPDLVHLYAVAAILGFWGSVFQPAAAASLPNLVPQEKLVAANAFVSGTHHIAIFAGPLLGGLLVRHLGASTAFALNACSFVLSALLIAGLKLPKRRPSAPDANPVRDLVEGIGYSLRTPLVRGILLTLGVVVFSAAIRTPLESSFVLQALGREADALGLVGGAWGFGMILGSIGAPAAARRWPRERLFCWGIAFVGLSVLGASRAAVLSPLLAFWLVAGGANAIGSIAYESLLQERTPDAYRGRVLAGSDAIVQLAFLAGALLAPRLVDLGGLRFTYAVSGFGFLLAAGLGWFVLVRRSRRRSAPAADGATVAAEGNGDDQPLSLGASPAKAHHPAPPPGTVLVLAPDLREAKRLCAVLADAGFAVDRAVDEEDLRFAAEHLPVPLAIVVDAPAGDRVDAVLELVRALPRWDGLPVVAVTSLGDEGGRRAALAASDFVVPPASGPELVARLRRLVPADVPGQPAPTLV